MKKHLVGGYGHDPEDLERDGNAIAGAVLAIVMVVLFVAACGIINWLHESAKVLGS